MKNYNRRDFLKLTGASALALSLAACGGGPSGPSAPAQDAQALYAAIKATREEKGLKAFIYDTDLEAYAELNAECFEDVGKDQVTNDQFNDWVSEPENDNEFGDIVSALNKKGLKSTKINYYGIADPEHDMRLTTLYPDTDEALKTQMDAMAEKFAGVLQYYIGIALVKIDGKTYWIAMLTTK